MVITTSLNKISINEKYEFGGYSVSIIKTSKGMIKEDVGSLLSDKEITYFNRLFRNKKRQEEMYLGRLVAKRLVAENIRYEGQLKDIELIRKKDKEKPKLFINNIHINNDVSIAHNDMYVVVGFSHNDKIGVDVENFNLILDRSFINYAFSKEEVEFWRKYEKKYNNIWILLWTIKEAIGKALDVGLSLGMDFIKILMNEDKLSISFKKEETIEKLIYGKNMELIYSEKDENYISICRVWEGE